MNNPMYLLDTNVISELRLPRPNRSVVDWLNNVPDHQLFISAVSIGEIQAGIENTRRNNETKATEIEEWLNLVLEYYDVLPMDSLAFREWARLMYGKSRALSEDAMIAATAIVHRLTVVTRNVRDFNLLEVEPLNPFV